MQVGTPHEIYGRPSDIFVATFIGSPPMNLIEDGATWLGFRPEAFLPRDIDDDARHRRLSRSASPASSISVPIVSSTA